MAKNHKWKDTTVLTNISKKQECVNCGVNRNWLYGDYQCWEYWFYDTTENFNAKKTFKRPECCGKKV